MLKSLQKDNYKDMQKRCQGAQSIVADPLLRIMMSHFVLTLPPTLMILFLSQICQNAEADFDEIWIKMSKVI